MDYIDLESCSTEFFGVLKRADTNDVPQDVIDNSALLLKLRDVLKEKYPKRYVRLVSMSTKKGWLRGYTQCTGDSDMCIDVPHYHAYDIRGMLYGKRDEDGRFVSPYELWEELEDKGLIPMETEGEWYRRTGIKPPMTREEAEELFKTEALL